MGRYKERVKECQKRMSKREVDLMVLGPGPNMQYLSGVSIDQSERLKLMIVPTDSDPGFILPELHSDVSVSNVSFWSDDENPYNTARAYLGQLGRGKGRVLIDDNLPEMHSRIVREICDSKFGLASEVMRDLRMIKSEYEIEQIRTASNIADKVVSDVRVRNPIDMSEKELAEFIKTKMDEYGGEGESFPTIVAAGENGANPHHEPGERVIKSGEPVVLDFGCWKNNHPSDQTRTVVFGSDPSDKFKDVFEVVRVAQQKAVEAVKPGMMTDEIDSVARDVIKDAGYGDQFIHRTGHGVGLEIHEHPKLPEVGEQIELQPNMVFSIEPGIYIEGEFGVRIEDLVLVTEDGFERLNRTERSFKPTQ